MHHGDAGQPNLLESTVESTVPVINAQQVNDDLAAQATGNFLSDL
jgi:hypothetical protein